MSDGSNTVTATVDVSELPASGTSDSISVDYFDRYWVGNSGLWNDTAHWSLTSGGTGGAPVPTANNDVYFDSNSFTEEGQHIEFS